MTTGTTRKVRIVKCPKCWQLLPEPANISVYQCGGCSAVLRAKNCRNEAGSAVSELLEAADAQKNKPELTSVGDGSKESGHGTVLPSWTLCSPDRSNVDSCRMSDNGNAEPDQPHESFSSNGAKSDQSRQDVSGECNEEGNGGSRDVRSSTELASLDNGQTLLVETPRPNIDVSEESSISDKLPEQPAKSVSHDIVNLRDSPIPASGDYGHPSSTLRGEPREVPISTSAKGLNDHVYQSSTHVENQRAGGYVHRTKEANFAISEEQVARQKFQKNHKTEPNFRTKHPLRKEANFPVSEEQVARQNFLENHKMYRNFGTKHPLRSSKSFYYNLDGGTDAIRVSRRDRGETIRHARQGLPALYRTRSELEGLEPSGAPNFQWDPQETYDYEAPLNKVHKYLVRSSSCRLPEKPEFPSRDEMDLLRMVLELEDKLKRTYNLHGMRNEKVSQQFSYSGKHFSSEAMENSGKSDYSSTHRFPHDRHYSVHLPPLANHAKGVCRVHSSRSMYNQYASSPLSSRHYTVPSFDHEIKFKHFRKERQSSKRHFRPITGGAPFIICYHCSVLLLVPVDFVLSRRRCHRLRCGSCSMVLEFSIQKGTHLIRYTPRAMDAPSRGLSGCPEVVHVSCSANYGAYHNSGCSEEESKCAMSSETEEVPGKTSSALHRLMGYSSISQLMTRSRPSASGASTSFLSKS
ncbi:protein ENHANCED DISEASE RESISTANCE 4-like [Syzygium oleosum]|uniref:protein ENHANCED DISEASE RESISTANCE 4-like n=1 Tax=Syzygium oleosum TaxID=219896 RepID=UPI0011D211D4|nr:protein ENHANCED DISEASE RESISTANCE 4-like [Syzygium oleosum]XP_056164939.1 protein ENHANCED DISEASE RESISTANCE 4-like [Syzygium oleosum]XP_056164940.1 protein ENHANCED DISEASE RESISTANCE 4-like [Syzygium oleosum]XP_056164941.1 protein ENHANCED DISEASE RESISTANCE 4-like [Syzygium oleosum]